MQITLNQQEIEIAISEYIESQVSLKEGQQIDIDLKATRGSEGFTASIDIVKKKATKVSDQTTGPAKAETPAKQESKPEVEEPQAETPEPEKEEPVADTATNDAEADAAMDEPSAEEPSQPEAVEKPAEDKKPVSLFSNLQKPQNK